MSKKITSVNGGGVLGLQKVVIYAFIDSQNLYLGISDSGWNLDYQKFRNYLRTKYRVSKAYLFIGYVPKNTNLYKYL